MSRYLYLLQDWHDLIEYVIHKFLNTPQQTPLMVTPPMRDVEITDVNNQWCLSTKAAAPLQIQNFYNRIFGDENWTQEEINVLYWYYEQSKSCTDAVGQIVQLFGDSGFNVKSRMSIVQQLFQQVIQL